jgi:lipopolysaccharide heptosyltransferase I
MTSGATSFLIVRLGALGDIVHAIPVVAALREAFPAARIGWLVHPRFVPLLQLVEGLDQVHPLERRTGARAIRDLRRARYDVCLDLQGLIKSAAVARFSGAPRVIGFSRPLLRESAAALAYTETGGTDRGHVIAKNLSLLTRLGITAARPHFPLRIPRTAVVPCTQQILGIEPDAPFALINPGAAWPNKRWPAERFGQLAAVLRSRFGLPSAVLWGPDEATLAAAVARASGDAARMAPQTTMVEMLALARAAAVVVSGDTGPLHLAAAAGTPVVGVYGPTPPGRNGPWDPADVVVSAHDACRCVFKRECSADRWCLEHVTVEAVAAAVARRLEGR